MADLKHKPQLYRLFKQTNANITEAHAHVTGETLMWFTHDPIDHYYVICIDDNRSYGNGGTVSNDVLNVKDSEITFADFVELINNLYEQWHFRLIAHGFSREALFALRQQVNGHIREDLIL